MKKKDGEGRRRTRKDDKGSYRKTKEEGRRKAGGGKEEGRRKDGMRMEGECKERLINILVNRKTLPGP